MFRSILFKIIFFVGIIFIFIISIPALIMPNNLILFLGKICGYWTVFCLKIFLGIKIKLIGKENIIKNEKFFVACAHQSIFETFFLQTIIKSPVFILKKELLKIPIFGWHLKKINSISINRNTTSRENLGFLDRISYVLNKTKRPIIIFPQGTRSSPEIKTPFKKGVSRIYEHLKIKCLPIALNSGLAWPKQGPLKKNTTITVSILSPLSSGMPNDLFIKELEEKIYKEIDTMNN